ncbi:MAG TPA: ABC transporter permease [Erysipelothrix sp.]|nr:ABC transporter permease [Erysipelothrix sp.]
MTVFKNYFRIVKAMWVTISIYSVIFFVMMFVFAGTGQTDVSTYSSVDVDVYVENKSDSEFGLALENFIEENMNVVDIDSNIEDELFYGMIEAVLIIPEDFDESLTVEYKSAPKSMYGMLASQKVEEFVDKVTDYNDSGFSMTDSIHYANSDLNEKVDVQLVSGSNSEEALGTQFYFNFLHYVIMTQVIIIIASVMIVYNKETISKRNEVSPVTRSSQNLQLTLGHIIIGLAIWVVYMIIFFIFWPEAINTNSAGLMMLNSFIFTISVVTLAVLLSRLIVNENILHAILNIVTLGASFLAGAFVPQELLSETTLNISKVLPSYYYIANNNLIAGNPTLQTMLPNALIMLAFSAVFVILAIVIKPKR